LCDAPYREDAEYVAETLVAWAGRYLGLRRHAEEAGLGTAPKVGEGEVVVTEREGRFLRGLYTEHHQLLADEPKGAGGTDLGPSPYDLLLMALGACTSMTIRMYAEHKGLALDDVEVRLKHNRIHVDDCEADCDEATQAAADKQGRIEVIDRVIDLTGDLSPEQRRRVLAIADRCPVHRTITGGPVIRSRLASGDAPPEPDAAD
jgi:putative redox protein